MIKPIVMYHHIKNDYKRGMLPQEFEAQFLRLKDTHRFSFDDGLKEHYKIAFPLLAKYGVTGYFFPIAETFEGKVNHVHKGHILLEKFDEELISLWNKHSIVKINLAQAEQSVKYSFDSPNISRFKKFLAFDVDVETKNRVFDEIMQEANIKVDAYAYYITESELKEMAECNMIIGNHSFTHPALGTMLRQEQEKEIIEAHRKLFAVTGKFPSIFSYPYGSYNSVTLETLESLGYKIGLTTNSQLEIGRLDCKEA